MLSVGGKIDHGCDRAASPIAMRQVGFLKCWRRSTDSAFTFHWTAPAPKQRQADRRRAVKALGKPLKRTQQVHHHSLTQLVICEDRFYHELLEQRRMTLAAGGDPNTSRLCPWCQEIMPLESFDRRNAHGTRIGWCKYCDAWHRCEGERWTRRAPKPLSWDWPICRARE